MHRRVVIREVFDLRSLSGGTHHHVIGIPVDAQVVDWVVVDGFVKLVTVESKGPVGQMSMNLWACSSLEEVGGGVTPCKAVVAEDGNIYAIFARNQ